MAIYNIVEKDKSFLVSPPKALHLVRKQETENIKDLEEMRELFLHYD